MEGQISASHSENDAEGKTASGSDKERRRSRSRKKHSKSRSRSGSRRRRGSRSRSRDRRRKKRRRSLSRSRSPSRSPSRDKGRHRRRSRHRRSLSPGARKPRGRSRSPRRKGGDPQDALQRELEVAERTIFVRNIYPKVEEMDLFEFFSVVGEVIDIRLIRDTRSGRSKGMAYVEFRDKEVVAKALLLNGQPIAGHPITIAPSQAEKNVAAKAKTPDEDARLYVGSLPYTVSEDDLRSLFDAFGEIVSVEIGREPDTGKSKGFGFVQYREHEAAKQAVTGMYSFELGGRPIKVNFANNSSESDRDVRGSLLSEENKAALQAKMDMLARATSSQPINPLAANMAVAPPRPPLQQQQQQQQQMLAPQPSQFVLISNMFSPAQETEPEWDLDIRDDVKEECEAKVGPVSHLFVDKSDPRGCVYLKLSDPGTAAKAIAIFNGRWFDKRQIVAAFLPRAQYVAKFPDAA